MSEQQGFNYVRREFEQAADNKFSSVLAEENVLRTMFKKPEVIEETLLSLKAGDFADKDLGCIYYAFEQLNEKQQKPTVITVNAFLEQRFPQRANRLFERIVDFSGYRDYGTGAYEAIADHIKIVKDLSVRRNAIARFEALSKELRDTTKDIGGVLSDIQSAADETDSDDVKWVSIGEVNLHTYEYLEKRANGEIKAIPTGITAIDKLTGGFFAGELTIIAARPSTGKSAFGMNIAYAAVHEGFKVGFVSCEMPDIGFGQRTLSRGSFVKGSTLRKADIQPEDWDKLSTAIAVSSDMPIWFAFQKENPNSMNLENIVKSARRKAKIGELDILIVDYIGIMHTVRRFKENRDRIAYISAELKRLAQVANIPVIALCQVNRDAQGSMPTMAQLRDSGSIEQDADGIIFLHRPEDHTDKSIHKDDVQGFYLVQENGGVYISISVAKQRNGSVGMCNVIFNPETMTYTQILRTEDIKQ